MSEDIRLFDRLCQESFQSGLSWWTTLAKRENFRKAFDGFEFHLMAAYFWRFEADRAQAALPQTVTTSPEAVALAKDLKKRGCKFVGPTTVYAFMQAMGLVNEHVPGCIVAGRVDQARAMFSVPASDPR